MVKKGVKILLYILLIIFILLIAAFLYFNHNKEKIVKNVIENNIDLYEVETDVDKITYSLKGGFKDLSLGIKDFKLETYDTLMNKKQKVSFDNCNALISLQELFKGGIKIKKVAVDGGKLYSHIELGKPIQFYVDHTKTSDENTMIPLYEKFYHEGVELDINDFDLTILDDVKNKRYHVLFNDFSGTITPEDKEYMYHSDFHMDAWVDELGFNLAKGTYGNQVTMKSNMHAIINTQEQTIHVEKHPLAIEDQIFQTVMDFYVDGGWSYRFELANEKADFPVVRRVLSDSIQVKLNSLEIRDPIDAYCSLEGKFAFRNNPLVQAKYSLGKNQITLIDQYEIQCQKLDGILVNREKSYDSDDVVDLADMFVNVQDFKGSFNQLPFEISDTEFEITQKGYGSVLANLDANGNVVQLTDLLKNLPFKISQGSFALDQFVKAKMNAGKWAIEDFDGLINVKGTQLGFANFRSDFSIHNLTGHFHNENADIENLKVGLGEQEVNVSGEMKHYENLFNGSGKPVLASIDINAPWLSLIALRDEIITVDETEKKERKEGGARILDIIAPNSQLVFNVKEFETFGPNLKNVSADLNVVSSQELHLNKATFDLDGINTEAYGGVQLKDGVFIDFEVNSGGSFIENPQIFANSNWKLEKGRFDFDGKVVGDITNVKELIENAHGDLSIKGTDFSSQGINLPLHVVDLEADVKNNAAEVKNLEVGFVSGNQINITTKVDQLSHLLNKGLPVETTLNIKSEKIGLTDFLFGNQQKEKKQLTLEEQKQAVWSAFHILEQYQPKLNILLDEFINGENTFKNVVADIAFQNPNTLQLNQFSVQYLDSELLTEGSIALLKSNDQDSTFQSLNTNIELNAHGLTKDYNDIFKDQDFAFTQGKYSVDASLNGEIKNFDDFAEIAEIELLIEGDKIRQIDSPIELDLDKLHLVVDGKKSELKGLIIPINDEEHLKMTGEIVNFLSLFDNDANNNPSTVLNVYSENLNVSDFVENFQIYINEVNGGEKPDTIKTIDKTKTKSGLKDVLLTIFRKYDPTLDVEIDRASYKTVVFDSIIAKVDLTEDKILEVSRAGFEFPGGFVDAKANVDIGKDDHTPFNVDFLADNVGIKELIDDSKLLGLPEMQLGGDLTGKMFLDIEVVGEFDEYDLLHTEDLEGKISLVFNELRMKDFENLKDKVKIISKDRFEDIKYAPIDIELDFDDGSYDLVRSEIQSTGFQLFFEGFYREEGLAELWFSVPLKNLKKRELTTAPEKTGFDIAGKKVYILYRIEQGKEPDLKVLFSNRKLYKDKGILDQYRTDKKKGRKARRLYRQKMRRQKRESK